MVKEWRPHDQGPGKLFSNFTVEGMEFTLELPGSLGQKGNIVSSDQLMAE